MTSRTNFYRTVLFALFIGPGPVIGLLPWWISRWHIATPVSWWRYCGIVSLLAGSVPLADSIRRFVREGQGTPEPLHPTDKLVVSGLYRYVRNPMYEGVLLMIFGQAIFLANRGVAIYGACAAICMHLFVVLYEERVLRACYGEQYAAFYREVPRWIPRLTPRP